MPSHRTRPAQSCFTSERDLWDRSHDSINFLRTWAEHRGPHWPSDCLHAHVVGIWPSGLCAGRSCAPQRRRGEATITAFGTLHSFDVRQFVRLQTEANYQDQVDVERQYLGVVLRLIVNDALMFILRCRMPLVSVDMHLLSSQAHHSCSLNEPSDYNLN